MELKDIMTSKVIFVNADDSVLYVLKLFITCQISGAPVKDEKDKIIGVVTKTDIVSKKFVDLINEGINLDTYKIGDFVEHHDIITMPQIGLVEDAAKIMRENHIHRIFVTDSKSDVVGVVSCSDILQYLEDSKTKKKGSSRYGGATMGGRF